MKSDPRNQVGKSPVYRWNPNDDRWQMWNGRRWVRSTVYANVGQSDGPKRTMSFEDTYSDLQEIA